MAAVFPTHFRYFTMNRFSTRGKVSKYFPNHSRLGRADFVTFRPQPDTSFHCQATSERTSASPDVLFTPHAAFAGTHCAYSPAWVAGDVLRWFTLPADGYPSTEDIFDRDAQLLPICRSDSMNTLTAFTQRRGYKVVVTNGDPLYRATVGKKDRESFIEMEASDGWNGRMLAGITVFSGHFP